MPSTCGFDGSSLSCSGLQFEWNMICEVLPTFRSALHPCPSKEKERQRNFLFWESSICFDFREFALLVTLIWISWIKSYKIFYFVFVFSGSFLELRVKTKTSNKILSEVKSFHRTGTVAEYIINRELYFCWRNLCQSYTG